ncbi:Protein csh3 [Naganishia albida]|nr:Protein csh3 [Naganishia albida]
MGFLQSTILGSISFLLGIVFVCQIPDIPLLYRAPTPRALENAYTFYLMWFDAPRAVKAVLHAALGLPLLPLIAKLNGWSESAVFFDGSSLVLHVAALIIYLTIHIPNIRTILTEDRLQALQNASSGSFNLFARSSGGEAVFTVATAEQQEEAVRVLAAGNALIGLCLLGILLMQAGQEYARQQEEREQLKIDLRTAAVGKTAGSASPPPADVSETKKDL